MFKLAELLVFAMLTVVTCVAVSAQTDYPRLRRLLSTRPRSTRP